MTTTEIVELVRERLAQICTQEAQRVISQHGLSMAMAAAGCNKCGELISKADLSGVIANVVPAEKYEAALFGWKSNVEDLKQCIAELQERLDSVHVAGGKTELIPGEK